MKAKKVYTEDDVFDQNVKDYKKWLRGDNVIKVTGGYKTQCTQYAYTFPNEEIFDYYMKEYGLKSN